MGQVLHGSAKTTHAIRGELQRSQASVASLAKRFSINEKTVLKWRKRQSVEEVEGASKFTIRRENRENFTQNICAALSLRLALLCDAGLIACPASYLIALLILRILRQYD